MVNRDRIELIVTKRTDAPLLKMMYRHYSKSKGFVGRNIVHKVVVGGVLYGYTVAGSATRFLPGRDEFLEIKALEQLNRIINNIFFHIERFEGEYPMRNFASTVISRWEEEAIPKWEEKYGDVPVALETLVELPRTGECYRRAGWIRVGKTKGYTCKRTSGEGTDSWSGKRVWDTKNLRPKWVWMKKVS